jgi:adenylate cyclase
MGKEIERKFLVVGTDYRTGTAQVLRQGYLNREKQCNVRVRTDGQTAFLTVKGLQVGLTRAEFEYPIPLADADQILDSICQRPLIEKRRYVVEYGGKKWEVDEFLGENAGLVVAEVELTDEQEPLEKPSWVGEEVTHETRYLNANLVVCPYSTWPDRAERCPPDSEGAG